MSIFVHASLIVLGLLLIPQVRDFVSGKKVAEQTIVPTAELATEQVGGIPNPGMNLDRNRAAAQNVDASVTQSDAWAQQRSATLDTQLLGGSGDGTPTQIGIGGGRASGSGLGNGVAGGGGLAKFGVPGGGSGIGPKGAVFGNGGNAYRIVFVCDGTGGMFDGRKLPLLMRELQATIAKLKPKQSYNVIFFREGDRPINESVVAVDRTQLLPAIPANNQKTSQFLSKLICSGKTKPIPAVELAFKLKPQLIYFLSDGAFDDLDTYDEVTARFRELNKDKSVRVNTIVFGKDDDTSEALKQAKDTMKTIAKDNGGNFLAVDPDTVFGQG
ncbi:MAG: hypothetical protein QM754_02895 [Tepidisphaeraceae bacterium]